MAVMQIMLGSQVVYLVLYLVILTNVTSVVLLCTVMNFNSYKFTIILL